MRPSGVFAVVLAACVVVAPLLTRADDPTAMKINFVPPEGWSDLPLPEAQGRTSGYWHDWGYRDGAVLHTLVLSATRAGQPAAAFGAAMVAAFAKTPGRTVLASGPATACGDVPAFTYTYRSDATPAHPLVIRHLLVDLGPLLGDVSYGHPPDVADRPDALDAMGSLCTQTIYAMRAPASWRGGGLRAMARPGVDAFIAPDGRGALIALALPRPPSAAAEALAPYKLTGNATLISDEREQCGAIVVRRARYSAPDRSGTVQLTENVSGYRHGITYNYTYTRAITESSDADAQRALTSFCDGTAALATPPAASTPAPNATNPR